MPIDHSTAMDLVRWCHAKKQGNEYRSKCPAHNGDNDTSLSIKEEGGAFVVKCFAHDCSLKDILAAAGLEQWQKNGASQNEIVYDYTDENGNLIHQAVRIPKPGGGKTFLQQRPDPANPGRVIKNMEGVTRQLYHLQQLKAGIADGKPVLYVEGEKCVEAAERLGYVATTNVGGSGAKWEPQYSESLKDAHVVMLPDNDEPGEKLYRKVEKGLKGYAASFVRVDLPGLGDGADIADWIDAGGTREELDRLIAEASEKQGDEDPPPDNGLPEIQTNNAYLRDVAKASLLAIHAKNNPPTLFNMGEILVRLDRAGVGIERVDATILSIH